MNIQPHWAYDKFCIIPWGWPKTWVYHSISLDLPPYYCHLDFWSKPGRFRLTHDECHEASREFRKKSSRPLLLLGLALAVYHLIPWVSMPLPWPFVKAESKGGILQQFACTQCPSLWLTHGFPSCQSYDCGQSPLPHFLTLRAPK